jgi:hypothetical protein
MVVVMNFASKLRQTGVYWAYAGNTGGKETFAAPIELSPDSVYGGIRWETDYETMAQTVGEIDKPAPIVYYHANKIQLNRKGRLYLGALADLTAAEQADPSIVKDVGIIRTIEVIPSLRDEQRLGEALCGG